MIGKSYDLVIIGPPKGRVFATHWRPCDRRLTLCPLVTHIYVSMIHVINHYLILCWLIGKKINKICTIYQPSPTIYKILCPLLINFALELVSHLLHVKQLKNNNIALFSMLIGHRLKALLNWFIISPLTHWGRDKMAAIFQTTFWNAFSWMKMFDFRLRFHGTLFRRVQ